MVKEKGMSYGGLPKDYNPWTNDNNMVSDKISDIKETLQSLEMGRFSTIIPVLQAQLMSILVQCGYPTEKDHEEYSNILFEHINKHGLLSYD